MTECSHENGWTIFCQPTVQFAGSKSSVYSLFSDQNVPTDYDNYIPSLLFVSWFRQHAKFPYHISYLFAPYRTIYEVCDIPFYYISINVQIRLNLHRI